MTHSRCISGLWIAPVVLATSLLAASTDVRLVNAVKNADKGAIQTLLPQHVDLSATDTDGSIAKVEFYVDGAMVGEDSSAPYAVPWTPR